MLCARLYIITCRLQAFITRTQCTAQYTKRSLTHSQMHLTHPLARDESFQIIYFIPSLLMRLFLICFSLFWLSLLLLRRSGIICTLYIYHSILLYIHSNISVDDYIFDIHPKIGSIIIIAKQDEHPNGTFVVRARLNECVVCTQLICTKCCCCYDCVLAVSHSQEGEKEACQRNNIEVTQRTKHQ